MDPLLIVSNNTYCDMYATEALRNRLDPGSRMLGALEFKHMSQQMKEEVCEYITRLEKAFREAYGALSSLNSESSLPVYRISLAS